ncbi:MAG: carboxypeptidase-like regulatory domain-containing protein [Candidatus Azobacteroides sp.]|nr:carboxypeptidase-like regulatory domain-containing protein [Candidatus Azobacteroides sp.]
MKKVALAFSCIMMMILLSGCPPDPCKEKPFATIYGIVSDNEIGDPIGVATVVLSPGGKTTVSGSDGRYEFNELDAQQYTITVQKSGYQTNRKTVTAITCESVQADIPLTPNK